MRFEYYVLNYNFNKKKVEFFNIFNNCYVQERAEAAVRKYLRAPSKYKFIVQYANSFLGREEIAIYGFRAFVKEIDRTIAWQERSRCEYEFGATEKFYPDLRDLQRDIDKEKFDSVEQIKEYIEKALRGRGDIEAYDCYDQAHANIEMVCHEIIRQYKEQIKHKGEENEE